MISLDFLWPLICNWLFWFSMNHYSLPGMCRLFLVYFSLCNNTASQWPAIVLAPQEHSAQVVFQRAQICAERWLKSKWDPDPNAILLILFCIWEKKKDSNEPKIEWMVAFLIRSIILDLHGTLNHSLLV